ncbi:protein pangolin, isoforms A/H/I/S-like isoform X3 [Stegodyphus dumicola]|uniref:protein pangolin, isoforms A/H/I/S-like isoform X3 n=1 Tax=Stegodyphus dumicola TaxID=202533 RepID=UPI0015B1CC77|nr:protein pangolin, isoforms A/H/I/S-like isoform X3 [Stegodyphus dumicola]
MTQYEHFYANSHTWVPSFPGYCAVCNFYRLLSVSRVPLVPPNHAPTSLSLMMYNAEPFQPPPAHMGIPPVHIDPKTGIPRHPVYPLPTPNPYHPVFNSDFAQFTWHSSGMYPMTSSFRPPPYPATIPIPTSNLPSKFSPPTLIPPHPGIPTSMSHHPLLGPGPKIEMPDSQDNRYLCNFTSRHLPNFNHHSHHQSNHSSTSNQINQPQNSSNLNDGNAASRALRNEKKKSHIKKPLNAFMLYMKEMRSKVVQECTLKESAAINQILGRRWHNLSREEQAKYYEMARKERQLHLQMYPGWTARDNYAINAKKKKRKRDKSQEGDGNNPKKCRARFGLDQQSSWCKPCRRKKKCIRYISGSDNTGESEDNVGSVGSVGSLEAPTPDSRFGADINHLTDNDSGNGDVDDDLEVSSEFSLSSPPVPRPTDSVQSVLENGRPPIGSPPSQQSHHPLNVQHLSRPSGRHVPDSPDGDLAHVSLPQLPTPPSTDSSTTTAPPLLAVT